MNSIRWSNRLSRMSWVHTRILCIYGVQMPGKERSSRFFARMTSKIDQEQYWINNDEPSNYVTAKEFSEAFLSFHVWWKLGDELATPFDKTKGHPSALATDKYAVSKKELLKACAAREFLLVYIFKIIQVSYMHIQHSSPCRQNFSIILKLSLTIFILLELTTSLHG